ncbi:glycoside hydrolase family 65 protein [Lentilactobacillus hilgardii]|uniref:glycoside hydrolase family 65 protein n=1 Tax=Lentilactobacillus hilgardii TaxID=1588 RepID=UPI0021C297E1|nr:glycosyl hydrolase family 65 protein [Lentilactobacillus hilgardii]MCP9333049.1 glycoside hydrolase family 65 protein [Lentilactobacillus hilgardii]MCP9349688.1 glycoside hydrolase family 65 protein [Lentilactobacillus hilgardii]MCP9352556.1 glycoside hydrolase family 65 protein [Lentilactobacillus hilgardii]
MRTFAIRARDGVMELNYSEDSNKPPFRKFMITYNPKFSIGDNLENIKVALTGLPVDAAIIENSLNYEFSDTIIGINHQKIDIGLAIANMMNVPVVNLNKVKEVGLQKAVSDKSNYLKWHLDYYGEYSGKRNYGQEAMLTIGNGYFGLRGAYVEANADQDNYPGTYVAGVYNQLTTKINDRDVVNEDLVNLPNSQFISFGVDHQQPFKIKKEDIQDIYRSLNLKTGVLTTTLHIQLSTGHILEVRATKVANMTNWHRYAIKYELKPINFSGSLQIYSEIDGSVLNGNVERYSDFNQHHLDIIGMSAHDNQISMSGQTKTSKVAFVINSKLDSQDFDTTSSINTDTENQLIRQTLSLDVEPEKSYEFEKCVSIFTGNADDDTLESAAQSELNDSSFNDTLNDSQKFWKNVWNKSDIKITNDITSQKLTRVNIYHMLVTSAALASGELDASVGARGLHGEAYRGHIFWDVTFDLPFYAIHYPAIAKQCLLYRYNRIDEARKYAKSEGKDGAMYPWQSGMYGDEQSQFVHLNPVSGEWDPDNSRLQRHVSISVAYDVLKYVQITGDRDFMEKYGLEMLLSICKFWVSMVSYDKDADRYDIHNVMGPDEFHEEYPNADEQGLTNNAYTNIMVSWLFDKVATVVSKQKADVLKAANSKSGTDSNLLTRMSDIAHKLRLDINDEGIIGQFSGYFNLSKLNFDSYRKRYGDISRIDRLLKGEGKSPDSYQVAKQADTLMAYYELPFSEVEDVINRLGYKLPANYFTSNLRFYLDRTTHGSTLSRIVYSVLDEMDGNMDQSWQLFSTALFSDYYDIQGGTTAEGIHLGVMGATLQIETGCYGGVRFDTDEVSVNPHLPQNWKKISFKQAYQGIKYQFEITHHNITVTADAETHIKVAEKDYSLNKNKATTISYK